MSDSMLTVADGVGGWARHGVDPSLFSREIVNQILDLHTKEPNATLRDIVSRANFNTRKQHRGSATITTMKIVGKEKLLSFNVGDSGYSHWRIDEAQQFKMLYESVPG
jgi:protein phosphatase PTC7